VSAQVIIGMLLVACRAAALPSAPPTFPASVPPTATAAPSPTATPKPPPSPTALPGVQSTPAPPICRWGSPGADLLASLPDPSGWRWVSLPTPSRSLSHLADLPFPIFPLTRTADGRRLQVLAPPLPASMVYILEVDLEGTDHRWQAAPALPAMPPSVYEDLLRVPDPQDRRAVARHWVNLAGSFYDPYSVDMLHGVSAPAALTGGRARLVEGEVVFPDLAGAERSWRPTEAPVKTLHLMAWSRALAQDASGRLWRGDLDRGVWEAVPFDIPENEIAWGNLRVIAAPDAFYALALEMSDAARYRLWRVPAAMGERARRLPAFQVVVPEMGRGPNPALSRRLGQTDWWWIALVTMEPDGMAGLIVDAQDGRILRPADFGVQDPYAGVFTLPSPDGRWIAMVLVPQLVGDMEAALDLWERPDVISVLASVVDPQAGVVLRGMRFGGWVVGLPAAWVWENATGTVALLPLSPGGPSSLVRLPELRPPLVAAAGDLLGIARERPTQVVRIRPSGEVIERLDLGAGYTAVVALGSDGHEGFALAVGRTPDGACRFGLVRIPLPGE